MLTRLAVLGLALGAAVTIAPPAQAADPHADAKPCVATRESRAKIADGMAQADLERRWEVRGQGRLGFVPDVGYAITYPWCEHRSSTDYYVAVVYRRGHADLVKRVAPASTSGATITSPPAPPVSTVGPVPQG